MWGLRKLINWLDWLDDMIADRGKALQVADQSGRITANIDNFSWRHLAGSIESLDHETLFTIQRFFENNLNVSETSRKLFVHRNTLVYRLEKIKKLTGLDLREFDHAIVFKIALMVKKYLSSSPVKF